MVARLINAAVLSAMETLVNRVIALDPSARQKLAPLVNKVLRVRCHLPPLTINILIAEERLVLSQGESLDADTCISGSAPALFSLLLDTETSGLRNRKIVITGNTALLSALQDVLVNLNVDWEYQLSKFIGDIPTQAVSDGLASAKSFSENARAGLEQDIDDYLHEEKNVFPSSSQLQNFYRDIDALRLHVDRLESRVSRLQRQLSR